jgi:hypothetical protein
MRSKALFFGNPILTRFAKNNFVEKEPSSESAGERVEIGFVPEEKSVRLLLNVNFFILALKAFHNAVDARTRRTEIKRILSAVDWVEHYKDKYTGRRVLAESLTIDYDHEKLTAICLAQVNYDVVFAPSGSSQASRVILDIKPDILPKDLIDGLRSGTGKNNLVKEIFLFYRNRFYVLPRNLIWSKRIFKILKNEKGYT